MSMNTQQIAKALGDPIRFRIMQELAMEDGDCCPAERGDGRGLCNCELVARLNMLQSRVSYHLRELIAAGLVLEEPRGKWHYYRLHRQTLGEYLAAVRDEFRL